MPLTHQTTIGEHLIPYAMS